MAVTVAVKEAHNGRDDYRYLSWFFAGYVDWGAILMTDDIVARLREVTEMNWDGDEITDPLCEEAADEIERLRSLGGHLADTVREVWFILREYLCEYDEMPMPSALAEWEKFGHG